MIRGTSSALGSLVDKHGEAVMYTMHGEFSISRYINVGIDGDHDNWIR